MGKSNSKFGTTKKEDPETSSSDEGEGYVFTEGHYRGCTEYSQDSYGRWTRDVDPVVKEKVNLKVKLWATCDIKMGKRIPLDPDSIIQTFSKKFKGSMVYKPAIILFLSKILKIQSFDQKSKSTPQLFICNMELARSVPYHCYKSEILSLREYTWEQQERIDTRNSEAEVLIHMNLRKVDCELEEFKNLLGLGTKEAFDLAGVSVKDGHLLYDDKIGPITPRSRASIVLARAARREQRRRWKEQS